MGLGKLWAEFKAFAFQGNMIDLAVAVVIGGAFGGVIHSLVGDVIMPTVAYIIHEGAQVAQKTKEVAQTAASKVGVATSQPATAPTTQATASTNTTAPPPTPVSTTPDDARKSVLALVETHTISVDQGNKLIAAMPAAAPAPAAAPTPDAAKPDDTKPVQLDFKLGPVPVGKFITELINFIILAFAVFIMMVKLLGGVMKKVKGPEIPGEPTTRECPECLSIIPIKAKRCSHCTAVIDPPAPAMA